MSIGMVETAQAILSKIEAARETAKRLQFLIDTIEELKNYTGPGGFMYLDDEGQFIREEPIDDLNGRLKDLVIDELVRQIEEGYRELTALGFSPE